MTHSTTKAALFQLAVRVFVVVGTLSQQIIIARIVAPSVFGLVSICMLTMGLLMVLSEIGVGGSIILEESVNDQELNFAWTIQIVRGLLLGGLMFIVAPIVSAFFAQEDLINLLRFMAIAPVIDGVISPQLLRLRREVAYGRLSLLQLSDVFLRIGTSIVLAASWGNAWALVVPFVASSFWRSCFSYFLAPHSPRIVLDWSLASRFFGFGRWAFVNSVLNYVIGNVDSIIVGRVLNAQALGFYSMAFRIGNMPFTEVGGVIGEVAFPALRKSRDTLGAAFTRLFGIVCLVMIPMGMGLTLAAQDLISLVLGDDWLPVVVPLQIIGVRGSVRAFTTVSGPLFNSIGRPDIQARLASLHAALLLASLVPLTIGWGINGTALAVVLPFVIVVPLTFDSVKSSIDIDTAPLVLLATMPLIGASLMFVGTAVITRELGLDAGFVRLVVTILCSTGIYAGWVLIARKAFGYTAMDHVVHAAKAVIAKDPNRLVPRH